MLEDAVKHKDQSDSDDFLEQSWREAERRHVQSPHSLCLGNEPYFSYGPALALSIRMWQEVGESV
jgi:hypothetical protein